MILEEKVKNFCLTGDYSIGKDILEQSYKLANTIVCNKYKNFGYTEDLLSESHDAIISAIYAFDPENKTKFLTFCSVCINNRIQNFIKRKKVSYKYTSTQKDKSFSDLVSGSGLPFINIVLYIIFLSSRHSSLIVVFACSIYI